jgi:glycosyltransferase involved in cell wall biosynthesis
VTARGEAASQRIVLDARTVTDHFPGIARYTANLASALSAAAPEIDLHLLRAPGAGGRLAVPNLPGADVTASPFSLRQQWAVPRVLGRLGVTVYHSPYYLMPYRPGVPTVLTCHDLIPVVRPNDFTATQRMIYWMAHVLALHAASTVLAVSEASRLDLMRYFGVAPERIVVTPEAADARFCPQSADSLAAARREHGLPESYALYVGSNKPHKNLVGLVEAWAGIGGGARGTRLVIAGHWDPRYPQARQRSEQLGLTNVDFLGPVADEDLPTLYAGALIFVFPSLYEGFGLPVLEAMACGTPVICSNNSSLPEVTGEAALLIDPLNTAELTQAMGQLVAESTLRQQMSEKGLAQAARFSWRATALATVDAYRQAVACRP